MPRHQVPFAFLVLSALSACHEPPPSEPGLSPLATGSTVALVQAAVERTEDLDYDAIEALVRDAVARAGGFGDLVVGARTVVLKPNICCRAEEGPTGVDTDWRVTRAVAVLVRELAPTAEILVMEGAAIDTVGLMELVGYTHENLPEVDEFIGLGQASGGWQEYDAPELVAVELPQGLVEQLYYMNRRYYEADVLVSLPVLKTHGLTAVTGAIKNVGIGGTPGNIYGMSESMQVRAATIDHHSVELHQWIRDYFLVRPVDYSVMDGLQGLENGPSGHDVMNKRLALASPDSVALDAVASLVMGWDPRTIEYLRLLDADGMGVVDSARITVEGVHIDEVAEPFEVKDEGLAYPVSPVTDDVPPALGIRSATLAGDRLDLALLLDADTVRVELFLDGQRLSAHTEELSDLRVAVPEGLRGARTLLVEAFDRARNRSSASAEL